MRLTIFNMIEHSPWGGSEELWYGVAKMALQNGHQVQLCIVNWQDDTHKKVRELQSLGVLIVWRNRVKSMKDVVIRKVMSKYRFVEKYLKKIEAFQPQAILISQPGSFDYFAYEQFLEYVNASSMPYFLISHFNNETGFIQSDTIINRMKTARPWSIFYFVAERNRLSAERQTGMKILNTKATDNPMNIQLVGKSVWPTSSNGYQLACVARMECAFKGQDVLLETLSDTMFTNVNYRLRFYGSGPDKKHVENLIKFYGLAGKVEIMGHVDNIDEIWDHNHALILPSVAEGTPLALREAMLKGRPALATDVGGNSALVIEGHTGFLVPVCAKEHLKQGLLRIFDTSFEHLEKLGDHAYNHTRAIVDLNCVPNMLADITSVVRN